MSERAAVTIRRQAAEIERLELERDQWRTRCKAAEERVDELSVLLVQTAGRIADIMNLHIKSRVPVPKREDD